MSKENSSNEVNIETNIAMPDSKNGTLHAHDRSQGIRREDTKGCILDPSPIASLGYP